MELSRLDGGKVAYSEPSFVWISWRIMGAGESQCRSPEGENLSEQGTRGRRTAKSGGWRLRLRSPVDEGLSTCQVRYLYRRPTKQRNQQHPVNAYVCYTYLGMTELEMKVGFDSIW
jgi:hypothetical protein